MGDEEQGQSVVGDEVAQQVEYLGTDGDVQGADRLVGEQDVGFHGQGTGDGDALALPAGELVREPVDGVCADADLAKHLGGPGPPLLGGDPEAEQWFLDDRTDAHAGIE